MKKEIKIALVAIAGIVILFFGMNFLKGMSMFTEKNTYFATFNDISGLSASAPIFANGYQVGIVKDIQFDYTGEKGIVVLFSLNDKMRLPAGTTATIASDFMGNVKMNLVMNAIDAPKSFLNQGDTIRGAVSDGLMSRAAAIIPQVEQMLPKIDSILMNLNALSGDPALARSLHNVETITADLTTSTRQLNTLMNSLNQQVPALTAKADGVLDNAQQLTKNLAELDVNATMQRVDQTIANVQAITQQLNNPDGTVGLLMRDPTLYNRLNETMKSAEQLLNDIREHPKRYINVSVF
ncbi:MAG: MCE family protein [Prevotella sp.]|nr:MCE family protein [Prevotella sp.]MBR7043901.1 MCE family protein [Prevotella sp.]